LIPDLGSERLDKPTEFRLRRYRTDREEAGAKAATVNRELATLSHLLNRAASKEWRWKADNKPEIPRTVEARKQIDILTPQQSATLVAAAVADQDTGLWLFVMFGLSTAMRHSEIVRRRFDELDWDNCRLWLDRAKSGPRVQPTTPALRDALKRGRRLRRSGWVDLLESHQEIKTTSQTVAGEVLSAGGGHSLAEPCQGDASHYASHWH
jgi:integrase